MSKIGIFSLDNLLTNLNSFRKDSLMITFTTAETQHTGWTKKKKPTTRAIWLECTHTQNPTPNLLSDGVDELAHTQKAGKDHCYCTSGGNLLLMDKDLTEDPPY